LGSTKPPIICVIWLLKQAMHMFVLKPARPTGASWYIASICAICSRECVAQVLGPRAEVCRGLLWADSEGLDWEAFFFRAIGTSPEASHSFTLKIAGGGLHHVALKQQLS
jgi:hypothetical protein